VLVASCQQGHAGSKALQQQNPPVLNWKCRLTQVDLYNGRKTVVVVVVGLDCATGWLMVLQKRGNVLEDCVGFDRGGLRGRPVCWLILPAAIDINAVRIPAAFVVLLRVAVLLLLLREPQRDRATRFVYAISGFYYRAMLCIRGTSHGPVSVCLSVRPSQAGVLLKRQNIGSHKQHHTIPQGL